MKTLLALAVAGMLLMNHSALAGGGKDIALWSMKGWALPMPEGEAPDRVKVQWRYGSKPVISQLLRKERLAKQDAANIVQLLKEKDSQFVVLHPDFQDRLARKLLAKKAYVVTGHNVITKRAKFQKIVFDSLQQEGYTFNADQWLTLPMVDRVLLANYVAVPDIFGAQ